MPSIPTCDSMTNRKVLWGAGFVGIFAKVRFQPWREIWSFYHLKNWGSFCDTFGWTWHEQSLYNIEYKYKYKYKYNIKYKHKPRYDYIWIGNLFPVELNVRNLALAPKLHCEHILVPTHCIVYILLFWKFKLILSFWSTNLMPASRSQVSSLRANGEIVRTGKGLLKIIALFDYWNLIVIVCLLYCWPLFNALEKGCWT